MSSGKIRLLAPGSRVAGYEIEGELGRGAMAIVYKAIQLNLRRPVALKILSDELAANEEFVIRFFNEARAAAALTHAHIVQAYDAGIAEGNIHYFAMEYVEGETLLDRIHRQGYLRPGPGLELSIHIADALNYGWKRQRLTHGDIKPANIILNAAGESKLADFGLAKVAEHEVEDSDSEILLTPLYAPPEVIRGEHERGDCRADIYSFGATLYHAFGGSPPFPGEQAEEVMERQLHEPLEPLRKRNPAVPGKISALIGRMLAKDPNERPESWTEVLEDFNDIRARLNQPAVVVKPAVRVSPPEKRSRERADHRRGKGFRTGWPAGFAAILAGGVLLLLASQWRMGRHDGNADPASSFIPAGMTKPGASSSERDVRSRPTDSDAASSWKELRRRLPTLNDPALALRLLEDYKAIHSDAMPADFPNVRKKYRDALEKAKTQHVDRPEIRQTTVKPPQQKEEPVPPKPPPAARQKPARSPMESKAKTRERTPPRTIDANTLKAGIQAVQARLTIGVALDKNARRQDDFQAFLGALSRLHYRVNPPIQPYASAAERWLITYPEASSERQMMVFLLRTVFPRLEEVLPKLVANRKILAGRKLYGRTYARCTVYRVTLDALVLRETRPQGVIRRILPWTRQKNSVRTIVFLSRILALHSTSLSDRQSYLALLLFSKYGKRLWKEGVQGLPDSPELRQWNRLHALMLRAASEGKAVRLWREALAAIAKDEWTGAYGALQQVRATRSETAKRHRERIEALLAQLTPLVPEVEGGRLVREAAEHLAENPAEALTTLSRAMARYGNTSFPEKDQVASLRKSAIAKLPVPGWINARARSHPYRNFIPWSVRTASLRPVDWGIILHFVGQKDSESSAFQHAAPFLRAVSLLHMGDWAGAASAFDALTSEKTSALPQPFGLAFTFSRGLVDLRYGTSRRREIESTLRQAAAKEASQTADRSALAGILWTEYALLRRGPRGGDGQVVRLPVDHPRGLPRERRRWGLDGLALLLEQNAPRQAQNLCNSLMGNPERVEQWNMKDEFCTWMKASFPDRTPFREVPSGFPMSEQDLRLFVSLALARGGLTNAEWAVVAESAESRAEFYGPLGGTALFDAVLAHGGEALSAGDLSGAMDTVDWALARPEPCMFSFYPRLCFLRWGLWKLAGRGGAEELAGTIAAAPCASPVERMIARVYRGQAKADELDRATRGKPEYRFWLFWLRRTASLGRLDKNAATKEEISPDDKTLTPAERYLTRGLSDWAQATRTGWNHDALR